MSEVLRIENIISLIPLITSSVHFHFFSTYFIIATKKNLE